MTASSVMRCGVVDCISYHDLSSWNNLHPFLTLFLWSSLYQIYFPTLWTGCVCRRDLYFLIFRRTRCKLKRALCSWCIFDISCHSSKPALNKECKPMRDTMQAIISSLLSLSLWHSPSLSLSLCLSVTHTHIHTQDCPRLHTIRFLKSKDDTDNGFGDEEG